MEESLCVIDTAASRGNGGKELRNQRNADKGKTNPRTSNTEDVLEWDIVERAPVCLPRGAEADVCLAKVNYCSCCKSIKRLTTQIEPQVNSAARPERARSQLKTMLPVDARTT